MVQFENTDDWFNNANNVEVLQLYCPHNKNICKKNYHKLSDECKISNIE